MSVGEIGPCRPSDLPCCIVEACKSSGTGADRAGKIEVIFHQSIQDALVVQPPESTALHNEAAGCDRCICMSVRNFAEFLVSLDCMFFMPHITQRSFLLFINSSYPLWSFSGPHRNYESGQVFRLHLRSCCNKFCITFHYNSVSEQIHIFLRISHTV